MGGSLAVVCFRSITGGLKAGAAGILIFSMVTVGVMLVGLSVVWVETAFFLTLVCLGMILPTSTTLALEPVRQNSGNAPAVLGFLTFFVGGICSPLAGMGNAFFHVGTYIDLRRLYFLWFIQKSHSMNPMATTPVISPD